MKVRFSITLDKNVVKKLDKKRGNIPRSTFINITLKREFNIAERRLKNE